MCVLPYLRHLVPEKKKSFTFSHFPFRTSTDHCCSRKRSPLTCYYCTCLLYNKFMYACILFTFSRRHARVYCLSVKRGAFISCEQLLLLLFFFCFFVFHKACGTIDLQALLRNGRTPFSTIVWMCILYDVNTVFFLVSLFIFFLNFAVKSRLDEFNAYAPIWYRANFCFTFRAKSKKKKILYLWLFPAGENLKRLYAHHVTGTHRNGRRYLCG